MPETKNVMNMARHFNNHREKLHANHKTHLHAMKAYNTGPVYSLTKEIFTEGGVRGVRIPQNRTEILMNTAQNNIRKPQTALKLPENF